MERCLFPSNAARVRISTCGKLNVKIEDEMEKNISKYLDADKEAITKRIARLDREWDTERVLEANAASLILAGTILGFLVNTWFFLICGFISFYLLMHALQGWCPPLPLIRRLGVRTVYEISSEKMALKLIRGDFDNAESSARDLLRAAKH